jgi:hypothetical protein
LEAVRGPQAQFVGRVEASRFGKLDEARAAQEELDRKRAERLGISQRVQGIRGMLPTQEALADIATRGANTIGRIEGETRGIPVAAQSVTTQQGKDILAASTTADRLAAGGSASGADRQFLQGLASFINKREMSLSEAVKYMSKANDTMENLNAEVARLNARLEALQRSTMNQIRR